jgi:hypothetical protein
MHGRETNLVPLRALVVALFGMTVLFHLGCALAGRPIYRASYLGTALEYSHSSIDLLRPIIVGFNATGTPTVQELPLWQAAAGLVFKLTHSTWYGWANLVSLALFATCLWPLLQLARGYVDERSAWWALAFFVAQPLIVLMAGEAGPDGFALAVSIWFLYFADRLVREDKLWCWLPAALFGSLAAVSKLPFFAAAGICSIFLLLMAGGHRWRTWMLLASVGGVASVAFFAWTAYGDRVAAQAEYPYVELRLSKSEFMRYWYLGDLAYRFDPRHWIKGGWRFLHATLGTLPFIALLLPACFRSANRMPKLWLLATFITTLIFTHVLLEHWHYYLICCPPVALLCGLTLARLESAFTEQIIAPILRWGLALLVLIFATVDGLVTMKVAINLDSYPREMSVVIREHTRPEDKLVLYSSDLNWGGEELFTSGRRGLSVIALQSGPRAPSPKGLFDLLQNTTDLKRLQELGFSKLVMISESPVRYAARGSNSGTRQARLQYPATISPAVDAWPVVFKSEDILIKEIPKATDER